MDELGDYAKNKLNPRGNQTEVGRTNEALRLGYVLLWLFARRLEISNSSMIDSDEYQNLNLLQINWDTEENRSKSYSKLMVAVCDELNIFVNGVSFPRSSQDSVLGLEIKDSKYLDAIARSLGDLDGIVGFILAGNQNCSISLLEELSLHSYSSISTNSTTKSRALKAFKELE
jgi:hypothetical protein